MSASSKKRAVRKYADLPEEEKRHAKARECYYRKIKKSLVDSDPAVTTNAAVGNSHRQSQGLQPVIQIIGI